MDTQQKRNRAAYRLATKHYWRQMWQDKALSIPSLLLTGVGTVFVLYIPPLVIARLLDRYAGGQLPPVGELAPYIALFAGSWFVGEMLWRLGMHLAIRAQVRGVRRLYVNALNYMLSKDMSFFHDNFAGSLTKKTVGYSARYVDIYDTFLFNVFPYIVPTIFISVVLWRFSPLLVLILLGMTTLIVLLAAPLIRYRKRLVQLRTGEIQRVEKVLEDAVIKIGAVASKTLTKSGRNMIEALIAGERDPAVLADMAYGRMRPKIPELMRALDGCFDTDHAVQLRQMLDHIDWLEHAICDLDARVVELTQPWADVITRLQTIPGVARRVAETIVAETGADMSPFPTHKHLTSWAGLCPGHNESAGKRRSGRTRHGDVWLRDMLTEAAWAAARTNDTYLAVKYRRVAGPRPDGKRKKRAAIAVAHKILIAAYYIMSTPDCVYSDLGPDWFADRESPERRRNRLVRQLESLGFDVELTPLTPTAA
jgi:transposase